MPLQVAIAFLGPHALSVSEAGDLGGQGQPVADVVVVDRAHPDQPGHQQGQIAQSRDAELGQPLSHTPNDRSIKVEVVRHTRQNEPCPYADSLLFVHPVQRDR